MQELGWSYQDLMNCPYEEYLNYRRLMALEKKEEIKEKKRQQRKAEQQT